MHGMSEDRLKELRLIYETGSNISTSAGYSGQPFLERWEKERAEKGGTP